MYNDVRIEISYIKFPADEILNLEIKYDMPNSRITELLTGWLISYIIPLLFRRFHGA